MFKGLIARNRSKGFQMRDLKSLKPSRKLNFSPWEYLRLRFRALTHQRAIGNPLLLSLILGSALVRLMRATGTLYTVMAPVKGMVKWTPWQALAFGGDQMTLGQEILFKFRIHRSDFNQEI
jgi:hypothetical protein